MFRTTLLLYKSTFYGTDKLTLYTTVQLIPEGGIFIPPVQSSQYNQAFHMCLVHNYWTLTTATALYNTLVSCAERVVIYTDSGGKSSFGILSQRYGLDAHGTTDNTFFLHVSNPPKHEHHRSQKYPTNKQTKGLGVSQFLADVQEPPRSSRI